MTNKTDRIITEARGLCWHELKYEVTPHGHSDVIGCSCQGRVDLFAAEHRNPAPSTNWKDYGEVLTWLRQHEYAGEFFEWLIKSNRLDEVSLDQAIFIVFDLLVCRDCPTTHGAALIAEFIEANPELFPKEEKC